MYWDWTKGRPILRTPILANPQLCLTTQSNTTVSTPICQLTPIDASRILGVFLTPTGDFSTRIQVLKTKADTFALLLRSSKVPLRTSGLSIKLCIPRP